MLPLNWKLFLLLKDPFADIEEDEDELENNEIAIEDSWLSYIKYIVVIKQTPAKNSSCPQIVTVLD